MAIDCPGCRRANNDDARACLYCGAGLTPREGVPLGRRSNPFHLAWVPSGKVEAEAALLGSLLEIEAFRARLLARSPVPRILRTLGDASAARRLDARARQLGLDTFLVDEHGLETHPRLDRVEAARLEDGRLSVTLAEGDRAIRPERICLIVTSRILVHRLRSTARISMLPTGAGSGTGLPRVVRETRRSGDHVGVLDLYVRGDDAGLRIREGVTTFTGADLPAQPSSLLRFLALSDFLRRHAQGAVFDDRFALFDDLDSMRADRLEMRPGVTVLDGIQRFDRYSRLRWLALGKGA